MGILDRIENSERRRTGKPSQRSAPTQTNKTFTDMVSAHRARVATKLNERDKPRAQRDR